MRMDKYIFRLRILLGGGIIFLCLTAELSTAQTISDPGNLVTFDTPAGEWRSVEPGEAAESLRIIGNPRLRLVGVQPAETVILLLKG